jgi:hypothetical protein
MLRELSELQNRRLHHGYERRRNSDCWRTAHSLLRRNANVMGTQEMRQAELFLLPTVRTSRAAMHPEGS